MCAGWVVNKYTRTFYLPSVNRSSLPGNYSSHALTNLVKHFKIWLFIYTGPPKIILLKPQSSSQLSTTASYSPDKIISKTALLVIYTQYLLSNTMLISILSLEEVIQIMLGLNS